MEAGLLIRKGLVVLIFWMWVPMEVMGENGNARVSSSRPRVVNVGALFTFNSVIGRAVKPAVKMAIDDVNSDSTVLSGTNLNLLPHDTNCSGFLGTIEALELVEKDVVAVIGPQSSGIAHVISHVVNELQVPLLSFGATDPTLASLQFPFFLRTTQSDHFQMSAIANLVEYYGWREVIAIFVDDDYGRNGISALGDALAKNRAKISYKAAFTPGASRSDINALLVGVNLMESRVYIVHVNPDSGLTILKVAKYLGMMNSGYVWITTDWLPSVLDLSELADPDTMDLVQGVIAFRHHTPDSDLKKNFTSRWKSLKSKETPSFNSYALYAYDSVWLLARALDVFFTEGGNVSFSVDPKLHDVNGSTLHLTALRIFDQGQKLLSILRGMNFTGLTGQIQFGADKNLIHPAFDILNIGGTGSRTIGYWSNYSGLSVDAPETLYLKPQNTSASNQHLYSVIWPGETTNPPRGWVFPNNGKPLRIAVPYRVSYKEFVTKDNGPLGVKGYCIDVFEAAVNLLPYAVPHTYTLKGDGLRNPSYNDLVDGVSENVRENTVSTLGRLVLILWLFVVLIINSSYTASLTSILTVQQLTSQIEGIESLISSSDPIGYQDGSFAYNYMIGELNIAPSRLKSLKSLEEYASALQLGPKRGGVAAVVDELPYIQLFMYTTNCQFRTVGQEFTKSGWGFAFQRDSPLAVDMSTAILRLSENGDLQRIHDKWLSLEGCSTKSSQADATRLSLTSFWGLFLICGIASFFALSIFFCRVCRQYRRYDPECEEQKVEDPDPQLSRRSKRTLRATSFKDLMDFVDKKEAEIKGKLKRKSNDSKRPPSQSSDGQPSSPS
ncbi:hypothetical protein RHSIM_Rhsim06G0161000 [Rhododendron simsii]|uniref:Glutamate receptor n=1 Tax=Rhododendron simsii TaxID=118357 RepID=A0A834LKG7_RHOSS|nr:hypothetical protein RHSIM_Rhsim06G0161000 [Rhododendron simsii]